VAFIISSVDISAKCVTIGGKFELVGDRLIVPQRERYQILLPSDLDLVVWGRL